MTSLFDNTTIGSTAVNNRIAIAPMTRSRASQPGDVPNDLMATYYAQRATAGVIISEGVNISPVARGYSLTPGLYSDQQVAGWKLVTDAVHNAGGKIFAQLWHCGNMATDTTAGEQPVSSSAKNAGSKVFAPDDSEEGYGRVDTSTPRAMSIDDIKQTLQDYKKAASNAIKAGFDGVELHGAHTYLIEQFMRTSINDRSDEYGGSLDNRIRFACEVLDVLVNEIGADKVGIRLSPSIAEGSNSDQDIFEAALKVAQHLDSLGGAFVHLSETSETTPITESYRKDLRSAFSRTIMVAGRYDLTRAQKIIADGYADVVAFGRPFITNPDLVYRLQNNIPLHPHATEKVYGGGAEGYTDYPFIK